MNPLKSFVRRDEVGHLITDSRDVAEVFGKLHKNVLRAIEAKRSSDNPFIAEFARLNFEPRDYTDERGRNWPCFRMTSKGMAELTMGFSGDQACELRIRFIDAFEQVSNELADVRRTLTEKIHQLERDEAGSRVRGQIGSQLMTERKRVKPTFENRLQNLLELAQGKLFEISA